MQLLDICEGAGIKCPEHLATLEIEGITSRSYEIKENYVFVCLKGTKNDGHGFIEDAFSRGACAVIVENKKYLCENSIFNLNKGTIRLISSFSFNFCGIVLFDV